MPKVEAWLCPVTKKFCRTKEQYRAHLRKLAFNRLATVRREQHIGYIEDWLNRTVRSFTSFNDIAQWMMTEFPAWLAYYPDSYMNKKLGSPSRQLVQANRRHEIALNLKKFKLSNVRFEHIVFHPEKLEWTGRIAYRMDENLSRYDLEKMLTIIGLVKDKDYFRWSHDTYYPFRCSGDVFYQMAIWYKLAADT